MGIVAADTFGNSRLTLHLQDGGVEPRLLLGAGRPVPRSTASSVALRFYMNVRNSSHQSQNATFPDTIR